MRWAIVGLPLRGGKMVCWADATAGRGGGKGRLGFLNLHLSARISGSLISIQWLRRQEIEFDEGNVWD